MNTSIFFVFFISLQIFVANTANYDNYKVYRLIPGTYEELEQLHHLSKRETDLDFWEVSKTIQHPTDVAVPPSKQDEFQAKIDELKLKYSIIIEDLQRKIDETKPKPKANNEYNWNDYHEPRRINSWLLKMEILYPLNAKVIYGGQSYEGRAIQGLKLTFKKGRKIVLIEGGIHAREWIAPAVVTYLINELLTSKDPEIRQLAESYEWHIFPSINPDGFEFTHTEDRLWRMNRQPHGKCFGADLNRNFGYHWNEGGTEPNCLEKYPGPYPFSETETVTFANYIHKVHKNMVVYLAVHSYLQLLLIPYGYTNSPKADNYDELYEIGSKVVEAARQVHGTNYTVGKWDELLYVSSGVSVEWVKGTYNTPITYTLELRDRGEHGFLLPPDQIIPTCQEIREAFKTLITEVKARGY